MMKIKKSAMKTTGNNTTVKVVVAIPCHNTQEHIAGIVTVARVYANQVVVIDDGSTDQTAKVAGTAGAQVIRHKTNAGYGAALRSCFLAAQQMDADILVIIDGDGQHEPREIPSLLEPVLKDEADLVIGTRLLKNRDKIPGHRKIGIRVITFLWNIGSSYKVSDSQSGFRAYNKKLVSGMKFIENGMSASVEILEVVRKQGLRIKEVPISCFYNRQGSTINLHSLRQGFTVALGVIKIRLKSVIFQNMPNRDRRLKEYGAR